MRGLLHPGRELGIVRGTRPLGSAGRFWYTCLHSLSGSAARHHDGGIEMASARERGSMTMQRKRSWVLLIAVLCSVGACKEEEPSNGGANQSGSGGGTPLGGAGAGGAGAGAGGMSGAGAGGAGAGGEASSCTNMGTLNPDCPQVMPQTGDCAPRDAVLPSLLEHTSRKSARTRRAARARVPRQLLGHREPSADHRRRLPRERDHHALRERAAEHAVALHRAAHGRQRGRGHGHGSDRRRSLQLRRHVQLLHGHRRAGAAGRERRRDALGRRASDGRRSTRPRWASTRIKIRVREQRQPRADLDAVPQRRAAPCSTGS